MVVVTVSTFAFAQAMAAAARTECLKKREYRSPIPRVTRIMFAPVFIVVGTELIPPSRFEASAVEQATVHPKPRSLYISTHPFWADGPSRSRPAGEPEKG